MTLCPKCKHDIEELDTFEDSRKIYKTSIDEPEPYKFTLHKYLILHERRKGHGLYKCPQCGATVASSSQEALQFLIRDYVE